MNAACQPHFTAMIGNHEWGQDRSDIRAGVEDPRREARSRLGNHSATVFTAAGKFAASEKPSAARAAAKPNTRVGEGVRHAGDAPRAQPHCVAAPRADPVENVADADETDRVGDLECRDYIRIVGVGPVQRALQLGRENPEHLAIEIVERRREEEQSADAPPISSAGVLRAHIRQRTHPAQFGRPHHLRLCFP